MNDHRVCHDGEGYSKREQILAAAYEVFSGKGYHRATIDEIIALADTGKGTVYNYFVNKEQLFYTLIREKSAPFEQELTALAESDLLALEKVEAVIRLFLRFYVRHANLWRVMMHEIRAFGTQGASNFKPAQLEKYRDVFKQTISFLETILQSGVEQGVLRNCDIAKAALGLYSVIVAMAFQNMVNEDIDSSAQSIADVFLYGVAKVK